MAIIETLLLLLLLCFIVLCHWRWSQQRSSPLTNWWVIGMLPGLLRNASRLHDFATEILNQSGGTFTFKGPWFGNMDMLVTADPANIHYILSKNFSNYPKGPEFRKIFDVLGDGIFNADSQLWENHRKTTMSLIKHAKFQDLLERITWQKVEKGLISVLDHISELGTEVDLQELFQRFTFDGICILLLGYDPGSLSIALPYIPCEKAFGDMEEAILYRHVFPESCWKLQKWLQIGKEKQLSMAWANFDQFLSQYISLKREEFSKIRGEMVEHQEEGFDFLAAYMEAYKVQSGGSIDSEKFLRDTLLSLMVAGRGTLSAALTWLFWLLSLHPLAEVKIREEIMSKLHLKEDEKLRLFSTEESRKLVYLHGALCEALRLFPPVSLEHKAPLVPDILPTGHHIDQNTKIILSFYSMGRMETIWGKDCLDFKPERWISEQGVKHEPSYKFPAFNAGPRSCVGKDMSFIQMKMISATIIYNYDIKVAEGHPISPNESILLHMKRGLKVRIAKRSV
ncbi:alkane hydroxylase MAH1-like [Cornus florida]|uniref:alkane hydroxylase MAH1-like n=1 Tax=Cornus florida TaxID=4283 RepID=UPI00289D6C33|nr:alkane hydroxylase MAH1-like [Cornus florida]